MSDESARIDFLRRALAEAESTPRAPERAGEPNRWNTSRAAGIDTIRESLRQVQSQHTGRRP